MPSLTRDGQRARAVLWEDDEWRRASIIGNLWQEVPAQRPAQADRVWSGPGRLNRLPTPLSLSLSPLLRKVRYVIMYIP